MSANRARAAAICLALGLLLSGVLLLNAAPVAAGILDASWIAPTTNTDGSPLTDLASYRVYYGTSSSPCAGASFFSVASPTSTPAPNQTMSYRLAGLAAATVYYVAVSAVDTSGNQSPCSNAASATARSEFTVSPTGTVNFGSVNIGSFAEQTYTVSNTVGGTLTGSASVPLPFTIVSGSPFSLNGAGATQAVKVRFTPATTTTVSMTISFTANGETVPRVMTGTGIGTDTTKPSIGITSPTSGVSYTTGSASLTLQGTASDNVGVTQVTWTNSRGGSGTATGTTGWSASGIPLLSGSNVLTVTARDAAGNTGTATLTATYDNAVPTVAITAPGSGSTVSGTVNVTATASDSNGVAGVQFLLNGVAVGAEQTTAPYSYAWAAGSVANGVYALSARARDVVGNTAVAPNVTVTVSNGAPAPPPTPANGLVVAYSFAEGAGSIVADASGNNNTGSLVGGVTHTPGKTGNGLTFNGTTGYMTVPDAPNLTLGATGTLSAWIKLSSARWHGVIAKGSANDNARHNYAIEVDSANRLGGVLGNGSTGLFFRATTALALNQWHHVAMTWDGATVRLWINGTQHASVSQRFTPGRSTAALTVGQFGGNSDRLHGVVDDVRIYSRALTQADLQTDMNTAVGGAPSPTPDQTAPAIAITSPGSSSTYSTNSSTMSLGGTASDNVGVTQVTWTNSRGGSGTATGTTSWLVSSLTLRAGDNVLTVTARDAAGNTRSATLTVTYNTTSPPPPVISGLVAAYGFKEGAGSTVADLSANNNTGTISGASWTTAGRFGSALLFDGGTAVVTVPHAASLNLTTGMTLEAWVYPTTAPTVWRSIIDKNVDRYYLMASSDIGNRPAVGGTWGAGNRNLAGPSVLPVNTWTHLAATFDGATVRLYVNGVQVASEAQTTPLTTSTSTLQIGGNAYLGENFAGRIDEVRVYNRALSPAEIQADMNTPVGGP